MRQTRGRFWAALLALGLGAGTFAETACAQGLPAFGADVPPAAAYPPPALPPAAASLSVPQAPRSGEHITHLAAPRMELSIVELQSRVLECSARIKLVEEFNPATLTVEALNPTQLHVRAESPGVTSIRITDEFDHVYLVEVFVERDLRELQANIARLFPGSSIRVIGVKESIVLQGWVTQPEQIPRIVDLARTYAADIQNHIEVGGGSLVQLKVKVLEVQRSKLEALGFNFLALGQHGYLSSNPGNLVPVAGATFPGGFAGPPNVTLNAAALANPTIQFAILGSDTLFHGFLEALKQESLLKILAEPVVATNSGRPATIHSGGEFPVLVPQGIGTATIQWREFGVRMETVPIVLGNGRVRLDVAAEVSERDFSNSIDVDGFRVPGITSRDVNTGVEMNFGETLMIGGLISSRLTVSTNKIPFLGDVPYLGAVFSRKNYQQAETELVILVTPHLVSPMNSCQVPTNGPGLNSDGPTTKEIFFNQHVEVPYFGPDCPDGQFCPPGMIGPGYSTPSMTSPTMPMMGPGPGSMPFAPPSPSPTPYLPGPTPETIDGNVEAAAAWNLRNGPGRASPALHTTPSRPNPNIPGSARTGAASPLNRPATSPGLIGPGSDYARPTPRFVGSSPPK